MPVNQPMTVVIHAHSLVAAKSSNFLVQMLSKKLDFSKVWSIQFIPGSRIRVTFSSLEYRNIILNRTTLQIDDLHHLNITASDTPVTNVHVHYLLLRLEMWAFVLPFCPLVQFMKLCISIFLVLRKYQLVLASCTCR